MITTTSVINLPDMVDGTCTCISVERMTKIIREGAPMTLGMYCICELEPKRGKKRKFTIKMLGLQEK